jgi:four helix bundle protein
VGVPGSAFRDLVAYRLAAVLANDLYDAASKWPKFALWSVGLQMVRAADSVAANIAEADGRFQPADRRRFLMIARGSLYETEHWILQAEERGLLPEGSSERVVEIARTLNGLLKRPTPA